MLEHFTLETFISRIGQTFNVRLPDNMAVDLSLVAVEPSPYQGKPSSAEPSGRRPFSLFFAGALRPYLLQGTYSFDFADLGSVDIFIVPIGPQAGQMRYEAVFT